MCTIAETKILIEDCYQSMKGEPFVNEPIASDSHWIRYSAYKNGREDPLNRDTAILYVNPTTREAVYLSRGTDQSTDWTGPDLSIALGVGCENRVNDAITNVKSALNNEELKDYTFSVAGHSLGGYITQGVCKETMLPGLSINGPSSPKVETDRVLRLDNSYDIVGASDGIKPGANRIVVSRPQGDLEWGFQLNSNIGTWNSFINNLTKANHSTDSIGQFFDHIDFIKALVNGSEEQAKLTRTLEENSTVIDSAKLNGQEVKPSLDDVPSVFQVLPFNMFNSDENCFGISFTMSLDFLGKSFENCYKSVINYASKIVEEVVSIENGEKSYVARSESNTSGDEPDEPVEPSEPTEPIEPAVPTEPAEPTEPVEPTEPSEPVEPTEPTVPSQPIEPVQPIVPTEPEQPDPTVQPIYEAFSQPTSRVESDCQTFSETESLLNHKDLSQQSAKKSLVTPMKIADILKANEHSMIPDMRVYQA